MSQLRIEATSLLCALRGVSRAVYSSDTCHPHISCVHFNLEDDRLDVVATNGHWIALWSDIVETQPDLKFSVTHACAKRLTRELDSLNELTGTARFDLKTKRFKYKELGELVLDIEGERFAPYKKVMPCKTGYKQPIMILSAEYMADVAESFRAASHSRRTTRDIPLRFEFGPDPITPAKITCGEVPEMTCVLLPMRDDALGLGAEKKTSAAKKAKAGPTEKARPAKKVSPAKKPRRATRKARLTKKVGRVRR